jgi:hypothetical protein
MVELVIVLFKYLLQIPEFDEKAHMQHGSRNLQKRLLLDFKEH